MRLIKNQNGYTVVETLIVLAVTGALFTTTALLIQGQVEKNRYQAGMRELQQMVQRTINDTENGYFVGAEGKSENLIVGKRFWFCADDYNNPLIIPECNGSGETGSFMFVETVRKNISSPSLTYTDQLKLNLPQGIKFMHFRSLTSGGNATGMNKEFGAQASFVDDNGVIGSENASRVALFNRPANYQLGKDNSPLPNPNIYGRILCFEGYSKGSLELGSATSGTRVELNMIDTRC